jgi:hypothetical protein
MEWRTVVLIIIMTLCVVDLALTFYYVKVYKNWEPNKPYKLIELNPLLVFLWNRLGLVIGMFVGAVIIISLNYIVAKNAHWIVVILLLGFLVFAMFNHTKNITLIHKLIEMYPSGYLPQVIFGTVEGNNPMPEGAILR